MAGRKYSLVPLLLWGTTFDRGASPYQDFDVLVKIRNDLVHYKMQAYTLGEGPAYFKQLSDRGLLLTSGKAAAPYIWLHNMSNSKAALWAYNTACRMAKKLMEFADEATRQMWQGMLENFAEVPDDYWKSIVTTSNGTSPEK